MEEVVNMEEIFEECFNYDKKIFKRKLKVRNLLNESEIRIEDFFGIDIVDVIDWSLNGYGIERKPKPEMFYYCTKVGKGDTLETLSDYKKKYFEWSDWLDDALDNGSVKTDIMYPNKIFHFTEMGEFIYYEDIIRDGVFIRDIGFYMKLRSTFDYECVDIFVEKYFGKKLISTENGSGYESHFFD